MQELGFSPRLLSFGFEFPWYDKCLLCYDESESKMHENLQNAVGTLWLVTEMLSKRHCVLCISNIKKFGVCLEFTYERGVKPLAAFVTVTDPKMIEQLVCRLLIFRN